MKVYLMTLYEPTYGKTKLMGIYDSIETAQRHREQQRLEEGGDNPQSKENWYWLYDIVAKEVTE
jgi:hypothetical protein